MGGRGRRDESRSYLPGSQSKQIINCFNKISGERGKEADPGRSGSSGRGIPGVYFSV